MDSLKENGIISRPAAPPLHTADYIFSDGKYESSNKFSERLLFLPSGPDQPFENVEKTIEVIKAI